MQIIEPSFFAEGGRERKQSVSEEEEVGGVNGSKPSRPELLDLSVKPTDKF